MRCSVQKSMHFSNVQSYSTDAYAHQSRSSVHHRSGAVSTETVFSIFERSKQSAAGLWPNQNNITEIKFGLESGWFSIWDNWPCLVRVWAPFQETKRATLARMLECCRMGLWRDAAKIKHEWALFARIFGYMQQKSKAYSRS